MGNTFSSMPFLEADVSDLMAPVKAADVGYSLSTVRGVPQNPLFDVAMFESIIDTFETRDDDAFICTFVKAGTTWCQQIVTLLLNGGEQGAKSYGETVPWLEALSAETTLAPREAPGATLQGLKEAKGPRFFKTHATVADLPRGKTGVKVIAVARNPKDTVVSLFHHASSKPEFGYKGDFETFCKVFLSGEAENGSWFKHVVEWHQHSKAHPDKCLWLTYEGIVDDHKGAVTKIANFLGLPATPEVIEKTVKNSTMKSMQANAQANIGLNHLRKGGVGGWRDSFTVTNSNLFDAVYKRKMNGYGLTFDFGEGLEF